jgi:hypothetical protein
MAAPIIIYAIADLARHRSTQHDIEAGDQEQGENRCTENGGSGDGDDDNEDGVGADENDDGSEASGEEDAEYRDRLRAQLNASKGVSNQEKELSPTTTHEILVHRPPGDMKVEPSRENKGGLAGVARREFTWIQSTDWRSHELQLSYGLMVQPQL